MNAGRGNGVRIITVTLFFTFLLTATIPLSDAPWSTAEQLTTDEAWDMIPSIMQTRDSTIWVVWTSDMIQTGRFEVFHTTSYDGGVTWGSPTRMTAHPSVDDMPVMIQTRDRKIWLFWTSERTGNAEIFYQVSLDEEGECWSDPFQLTNNTSVDEAPSIAQNLDGTICLVWHRINGSNRNIFCKTYPEHGPAWSNETQVTNSSGWNLNPSITHLENGTLLVAFSSSRADSNFEIFSKTSPDNGLSWSNATRLTTTPTSTDGGPAVVQDASGTIWVVWAKDLDIYYMTSPFPSSGTKLTSQGENNGPSAIYGNDGRIWVVWESTRSGNFDIYLTVSDEIPSVHDIAVTAIKAQGHLPRGTYAPINVTVENQGHFTEIFNVTAYAERNSGDVFINIDTQHNVSLAAGTSINVTLTWNTTDTPFGTYYISANVTIVPGEHEIYDNILIDGAKIGGICVPWQPQTNLPALLGTIASVILIIIVLGAIGVSFFKALMSVRLPRPWRLLVDSKMTNLWHR